MGGFWESRGKVAGLNTQRRTLFILYSITIIFITYSKVTNKNLSKLESPKSKSKSYEAAQKGKKLGGAELWEIEGGHLTTSPGPQMVQGDPNASKGIEMCE